MYPIYIKNVINYVNQIIFLSNICLLNILYEKNYIIYYIYT